jgi:hypothetical protein
MDGYVATERIIQARPRFVGTELGWSGRDALTEGAEWATSSRPDDQRPWDQRLHEAWANVQEAWAQTTFFLFDPNSWR